MSLNDVYEIVLILSVLVHISFSSLLLGGFPLMVMTTWLGGREGEERAHLKDLAQKMRSVGPRLMGLAISLGVLASVKRWMAAVWNFLRWVSASANRPASSLV